MYLNLLSKLNNIPSKSFYVIFYNKAVKYNAIDTNIMQLTRLEKKNLIAEVIIIPL
jgi:hypothetical protein